MNPKKAVIKFGSLSVGSTPERVVTDELDCSSILVAAPSSNGASVWVGTSEVDDSGNGFEVEPGAKIPIPMTSTSRLYAVVTTGSESLSYMVLS